MSPSPSRRVWFITGASKGFGRVWTEAALARADHVAAASRTIASLDALPMVKREYAERLANWEAWNDVALEAQGTIAA